MPTRRLLALLVAAGAFAGSDARAETPVPAALKPLFARLAHDAAPEYYEQIAGAVNASPMLSRELEILVARGGLTKISVLPGHNLVGSPFNAWADRATIFVYTDFLKAQLANRVAPVSYPDDIPPNNTVFCLGHLAHHLTIGYFSTQGVNMTVYVRQNLEREAGAYLQGWNSIVDAAVQSNGGKPLSPRQATQLMLNMRYRFAFAKVEIPPTGFIETRPRIIDAIMDVLRASPPIDLH